MFDVFVLFMLDGCIVKPNNHMINEFIEWNGVATFKMAQINKNMCCDHFSEPVNGFSVWCWPIGGEDFVNRVLVVMHDRGHQKIDFITGVKFFCWGETVKIMLLLVSCGGLIAE